MERTQPKAQKHIIMVFLLIYILNCTDLIFTYTYLKTGLFMEYNPIMRLLLSHVFLTLFVKLMIPAILIVFFFFRLDEHTTQSLRLCKWAGAFLSFLYSLLNSMHIYYLFQFLLSSS